MSSTFQTLERLRRDLSPIDLWQLKLVLSFASKCSEAACLNGRSGIKAQLISSETCQLLQAEVEGILIKCLQGKTRRMVSLSGDHQI